jgi:putative hydrolase of HD superfamily
MKNKGFRPMNSFRERRLSPPLRVYLELNHLKQLYRQGWLRRGVPAERCESVADHAFGVATLALLLADEHFPELDRDKLLRMALLHEFGEIDAGDLTPGDGVPLDEKRRREAESVKRVLGDLPNGRRYIELWREYAEGRSAEARFLREVDRLEMGLQALVYEHQGLAELGEFYDSVDRAVALPELRSLLDELQGLRAP